MSIKLIATDMDGTFLREDKTYDHARFHRIRQVLKEMGIQFVIASGNSYHQLKLQFSDEDMAGLYFVGDNGNYIVHDGDVIRNSGVPREEFLDVMDYLGQFSDRLDAYISTGARSYVTSHDETFNKIARVYNGILVILDDFREIPQGERASKIAIITKDELDPDNPLIDDLRTRFPDLQSMTSGNIFIDIIPAGSGKGSGIKLLQQQLRITPAETMVFGDQMNDASMMEVSDFSVAMANSIEPLLPYANYQIGTNEEQGVLDVLEMVIDDPSGKSLAPFVMNH
ncbi:MAG: Cof-type HAD-IIB family hydrolase [Aerococcus sp.]|nr:Cof-type HAD-IIB family hydrolase [Aerococcus sp.]